MILLFYRIFQFHWGLTKEMLPFDADDGRINFQFHWGLTKEMLPFDADDGRINFQFHWGLTEGFYIISYLIYTLLLYKFFCA